MCSCMHIHKVTSFWGVGLLIGMASKRTHSPARRKLFVVYVETETNSFPS